MPGLRGTEGEFEILDGNEGLLQFADRAAALSFLRGFPTDPLSIAALRRLLARSTSDVSRLTDEQVLSGVALLLSRGDVHLLRRDRTNIPYLPKVQQPVEEPPPPRAPPSEEKTWVEIELVDEEGAPVPNARYILKLPDGSTREGKLDAEGKAKATGIPGGTCKVNFPDYSPGEWRDA